MNRYIFTTNYRPQRPLVGQIWKTPNGGEVIVVGNISNHFIEFEPVPMQNQGWVMYKCLESFLEDFSL